MAANLIHGSEFNFVRRVLFAAWLVCLLAGLFPRAAVAAEATVVWPFGVSAYPAIQSGDEARGGIRLSLPVTQGETAKVRVRSTDRGTAVPGEDFVPVDGVFSVRRLDSGEGEYVAIQLIPDSIPEGWQTIVFEVSAVSPNTLIRNNDVMETSLLVTVHFLDDDAPSGQAIFPPQPSHTETVGARPVAPIIADLNRDGRADVVVALEADHAVAVLLGRTNGWFSPAPGSPFPAGKLPVSLAVADLDGDDLPDVLAVNRMDNAVTFLKGDGQGGLAATGAAMPTGVEPRAVRVADFNGDTLPDLLVSNYGDGTLSLLLGDGKGVFREAPGSPIPAGLNPWGLATGDFDQNGTVDFAVALTGGDAVRVFLNQGDGAFPGSLLRVGSRPFDVTVTDLDRDGRLDLVSADTGSHSLTAFRGQTNGAFEKVGTWSVDGSFPRMVVPVDLTRDGYPELVVANEHFSVSLLAGPNQYAPMTRSPLAQPGILNTVAAGDLNGDGTPDLIACGPDFGLTFWLNEVRGNLVEVEIPRVFENDPAARITFRRTHHIQDTLRLLVSTRDETAVAGRDYQGVSLELNFQAGETNKVAEVPLVDDRRWSGSRTFTVEVIAPDSPVVVPGRTAVTILDDEPQVNLEVRTEPDVLGAGFVSERSGRIRFIVSRTAPNTQVDPFAVQYRVEGGADVEPVTGTFRFEEGVAEQAFEVRLHDNFEVDGSRSFRVVLTGKPGAPGEVWRDATVEIRDDETSTLGQEVAIAPYLSGWGETGGERIVPLSDGRTLVWLGKRLMCLSPQGTPDPQFSRGTGPTWVPFSVEEYDAFRVLTVSDGSLYLVGRLNNSGAMLTVVRIGPDGRLDKGYGDGEGLLSLPGIELLDLRGAVFIGPDDGLILCFIKGGKFRVRRLTVAGRWDSQFQEWTHDEPGEVVVSPTGIILARVTTGGLVRLQADGRVDPSFKAPSNLVLPFYPGSIGWSGEPVTRFDAQGRFYAGTDGSGSSEGTLVRILGDGSVDRAYQPLLGGIPDRWEVMPSGDVVALLPGALVRIAADGTVHQLHWLFGGEWVSGFFPLRNGEFLVQFSRWWAGFFGGGGWWGQPRPVRAYDFVLYADGTTAQFPPMPIDGARVSRQGHVWRTVGWESPAANPSRMAIPRSGSKAGLTQTGVFCPPGAVRATIRRTGSTAAEATVRGRIWKRIGGRLDEPSVRPWEGRFPRGESEIAVDFSPWLSSGNAAAGEYLVRLEESAGVQLSEFTACRLWVLPDSASIVADRLGVAPVPDADFDGEMLLVLPENQAWRLQESATPAGPWKAAPASLVGVTGSSWVYLPWPGSAGARYFRQ